MRKPLAASLLRRWQPRRSRPFAFVVALFWCLSLLVPTNTVSAAKPPLLLFTDARFVYEPNVDSVSLQQFFDRINSPLRSYQTPVGSQTLSAAQAATVAGFGTPTDVNPRVLLALVELRNGLLTTAPADPAVLAAPFGPGVAAQGSFGRELLRVGQELRDAFNAFDPATSAAPNAATFALQTVLAEIAPDPATLEVYLGSDAGSFVATYARLFGDPFAAQPRDTAVAPGEKPLFTLPFAGDYSAEFFFDHNNPAKGMIRFDGSGAYEYDDHTGTDFPTPAYTQVLAAADGVISYVLINQYEPIQARCKESYTPVTALMIRHAEANGSYQTMYWHLSPGAIAINPRTGVQFQLGDAVSRGEVIGYSGNTGCSSGPHLHFEVKRSGVSIDPFGWCGGFADPWRVANETLWAEPRLVPQPCEILSLPGTLVLNGSVKDQNGQPIADTLITTGQGQSATTDANGNYELSGLDQHTYVLTAIKDGYTFLPTTRTLTVTASVSADAFTAVPLSGRKVVVLVGGWNGLGSQQQDCSVLPTNVPWQQAMQGGRPGGNLYDWLTSDGYEVWTATLTTGPERTDSLRANAGCLQKQIRQISGRSPNGKVVIIAHSMGGLVARAYLEGSAFQNDVDTLFTLGTPHQGLLPDILSPSLLGQIFNTQFNCGTQKAICEMLDMGSFNSQFANRAAGVNYYSVGGDLSIWNARNAGIGTTWLIPGPDDGLVSQSSSLGLPNVRQSFGTSEAHNGSLGAYDYYSQPSGAEQSIAYWQCIGPVLRGDADGCPNTTAGVRRTIAQDADLALSRARTSPASTEATTTVAASTLATQNEEPNITAVVSVGDGTLEPGQQLDLPLGMDQRGALFVNATWGAGDAQLVLVSPNGQIIDAAYAAAHPNAVTFIPGQAYALFQLKRAEPGLWTVRLTGTQLSAPTTYHIVAALESSITLDAQSEQNVYAGGQEIAITANVKGSVRSASLVASLTMPNGKDETLTLAPLGNGSYRGTMLAPNTPGTVLVRVQAQGSDQHNAPFLREKSLSFQLASPAAQLTGTYSDRAENSNADGPAEALAVDIGIDVREKDMYLVTADLAGPAGSPVISRVSVSGELAVGVGTLTLRFPASEIAATGRSSAFQVVNLQLFRVTETNMTLPVARAANAWTTQVYQASQWNGTPPQDTRVRDGLQVLYTFQEGMGTTIHDTSGIGTAYDLTIQQPERTRWLAEGLAVDEATTIQGSTPADKLNSSIQASGESTIELWITAASTRQPDFARILSLSDDEGQRNVSVFQRRNGTAWSSFFQPRFHTTRTWQAGASFTWPRADTATTLSHLVITRDVQGETCVYLNGARQQCNRVPGDFSTWKPEAVLRLASEAGGRNAWLGTFQLAAVYSRALSAQEVAQNYAAQPNGYGTAKVQP